MPMQPAKGAAASKDVIDREKVEVEIRILIWLRTESQKGL